MPTPESGLSRPYLTRVAGMPGRRMADGFLEPRHYANKNNRKYIFEDFSVYPRFAARLGNGAATGATGDRNQLITNRGTYVWHVKGAGQTILVPVYDDVNGKGLDFGQDQTATEGHELMFSPNIPTAGGDRGILGFKIGTDEAFVARLKVLLSDWSGVNPLAFGIRRVQAEQAALASYTDYAAFKVVGSGTTGSVRLETNLNNAGAVTTDTSQTKADNVAADFRIHVGQDGKVRFWLDDGAPTVNVTNFVFDVGDIVIPFAFFLHGADLVDNLWYQEFEGGYLPKRAV